MAFAEPGVKPHYAPSRDATIQHISLHLHISPQDRSFRGEAHVRLSPLPGYQGEVTLDLADVDVDGVFDASGAPLPWHTRDETLRVRVDVPELIIVRWHGERPSRGLYFTGPTEGRPDRQQMAWTQCQDEDGHYVFPCFDHPGSRHPWTLEIDAPEGYTILSNGAMAEEGTRDGGVFARYEQVEPIPAYLITVVVAKLSVTTSHWRDRPVRYLVPQGEEAHVVATMAKTPLMIEAFSQRTGVDYPWPRYDQVVVHDFIFGGMENVACTTMTDVLLVDPRGMLEWDPDRLVAHELAHQWFGDLVTCQDWSQAWLNESWATFMEQVWWEHDRDAADAVWYRWDTAAGYFAEDSGRYRRPIVSYNFREPIDVFDRHLYEKGACVLATLRDQLGAEAFWAGTQAYLEGHRLQGVHTRHFQRALEQASGQNLDAFFQQWILSAGHPALTVRLAQESGLLTVSVQQTQDHEGTPEVYDFKLRLELVYTDGSTQELRLPVHERERTWAIPTDRELATVRVDPGFHLLAKITLKAPIEWLSALIDDTCPVVAARAAEALLTLGSAKAVQAVVDGLSSQQHWGPRSHFVSQLGKRRGDEARDALIDTLADDPDSRVRRAAATALGGWRDASVASALIAALDAEPETWQLFGAVLASLGATRDPRAGELLRAHLHTPSWADTVRQKALSGLAATRDPEVLPLLMAHSRGPHPERVRGAACAALGLLADNVEACRKPAVERLLEVLSEPGFRTHLAALAALARLRDPSATPTVERLHRSAPDGRIRREAYETLVAIRAGRSSEAGLLQLRAQVDRLAEENAKLRGRLDRLESRLDP